MRAVITGATGLVGSNLAAMLVEQGHEVRCTRRPSSKVGHLDHLPIEWVHADLSDEESLARAFDGADVVFHAAAEITFRRRPTPGTVDTNVEGTRRVLSAVRRGGVGRLVHCSSVVAAALSEDGQPVKEGAAWNFEKYGLDEGYSITKRQAQTLVEEATDVDSVIVQPCYMFGPLDPKPSSGQLILNVLKGTVPGYTTGYNNFVDVRDVCRGMIAAWQKGKRGEVYILGHENITYRQMMETIARVGGVRPPRLPVPRALGTMVGWGGDLLEWITGKEPLLNSVTMRYAFCREYMFSSDKARAELGYTSGPIEVAVEDAIAWFKMRGMV